MRGIFIAAVLGLAACAPALPTVQPIDLRVADFGSLDNLTLCAIFSSHVIRSDQAKDELDRRHALSVEDWQKVIAHTLYVGMPECAVVAAFGPADQRYLFKDGGTGRVVQTQYLFDCVRARTPECPYTDVIVVDDKVLSWSAAKSTALLSAASATPAPIMPPAPAIVPYGFDEDRGDGGGGGGM